MADTLQPRRSSLINKIKKPISAFFLFCKEKHQEFLQKYPNITNIFKLTKYKAQAYKELTPGEKAEYEQKAREESLKYEEEISKLETPGGKTKGSSIENTSSKKKVKLSTKDKENENSNSSPSKKKKVILAKTPHPKLGSGLMTNLKINFPFPGVPNRIFVAEINIGQDRLFLLEKLPLLNYQIGRASCRERV